MNLFDKIASPFRRMMGYSGAYDGANYSNKRRYILRNTTDSKATMTPWVRSELLSRARYLYNNVGMVKGAIGDIALYSVGTGFIPQAQTSDQGWNDAAEAYWREWVKVADVTGKFTFDELAVLSSKAIDRDGDIGIIQTELQNGFPQLQMVEGHRIESRGEDKDRVCDGVILDKVGRPIAYRVAVGDDGEAFVDIPSNSFIHLFDPERCDQVRGISALAHAVNNLQDIFEILGFERMGVKMNASIALIETNEDGEADTAKSYINQADPSGNPDFHTEEFNGGEVRLLRAGTGSKIEAHSSNRPSPTFTGFLEYIARDAAVGLGVPLEFIWNAEKMGGATQRFVLQKAQRRFECRQGLLTRRLYSRAYGWVISKAIKNGKLPKNQEWWKARWQAPAKISVDVGREAQQNREDVRAGMRTISEDAAERGVDWQEMRNQIESEADDLLERAGRLSDKHGINLEAAINILQQRTPNGNFPVAQTTPEPPPSNG